MKGLRIIKTNALCWDGEREFMVSSESHSTVVVSDCWWSETTNVHRTGMSNRSLPAIIFTFSHKIVLYGASGVN